MIEIGLIILALYVGLGLIFAVPFVVRVASTIDEVAGSAPLRVRALFLPGAVALWLWLAVKWLATRHREGSEL